MANNKNVEKNIDELINNTIQSIKNVLNTNLIFGEPIVISNSIKIIPLNKVSLGFVSGGGEISDQKGKLPFCGGVSTGINMYPLGYISVVENKVDFVAINNSVANLDIYNKLIDKIYNLINNNFSSNIIKQDNVSNNKKVKRAKNEK